ENAAVRAADVVARLATPGPPRVTPVMETFLRRTHIHSADEPPRLIRALAAGDARLGDTALAAACDPMVARVLGAVLRDTISPTVVHAGVKYKVIPGEAPVAIECRVLPGATEEDMREIVIGRLGELAGHVDVDLVIH